MITCQESSIPTQGSYKWFPVLLGLVRRDRRDGSPIVLDLLESQVDGRATRRPKISFKEEDGNAPM